MAALQQFSVAVRNAMLDQIEVVIGTAAILRIRSGAAPANCAAADSGTVLATITLASDWASAAAAGVKALSGLPVSDPVADASGTAGHYRLYDSGGTVCGNQGTVGVATSDLIVDSVAFTAGQTFNITAWSWTAPGA